MCVKHPLEIYKGKKLPLYQEVRIHDCVSAYLYIGIHTYDYLRVLDSKYLI